MTTPTVPVTVKLADFGGPSIAGVRVTAKMDQVDRTAAGVFVSTEPVMGVTDVDGVVILECFPCAVAPSGLGTVGATIVFSASMPGSKSLKVRAAPPNLACNLVDILVDTDPVALASAEIALQEVQEAKLQTALDRIATGEDAEATADDRQAVAEDKEAVDLIAAQVGDLGTAVSQSEAARDAAEDSAADAFADANAAQLAQLGAEDAQAASEVARDAALASTRIYASTAAGISATTTGQYFYVPSADSTESLILYLNSAGSAVEQKRYLSSLILNVDTPIGYAWAVTDGFGRAPLAITDAGTVEMDTVEIEDLVVGAMQIDTLEVADVEFEDVVYPLFAWAVSDGSGHAALGIKDDGTVVADTAEIDALTVTTLNGERPNSPLISRRGGVYSHQINFINSTGQSLGEGSTPAVAVTTAQEYDNVGFAARASSPTAFVALTVANTQYSTRGESPMYGALGHIKELIAEEHGLSYSVNDYQLAVCNNSYSGYSITQLYKGTAPYTAAMSQIQAAYNIAVAAGKSMCYQGEYWTQGETDTGMAKATYKGHLKQLAIDYDADARAITGQYNLAPMITYQCATVSTNIALAQLEASNESPLIFMACPMYMFDYGDSLHITSSSAKWLGGYYGLAHKRVVVDGQDWKPLQPIGHALTSTTIDLIFNKTGLVLDTTIVPAQTNNGFDIKDVSNVTVPVLAVAIVDPNRVRLTVGSAPAAGWSVRYGFNAATGKSPFVGGCGNLRDSQGDTIVYSAVSKPMHNWCVIFNYSI